MDHSLLRAVSCANVRLHVGDYGIHTCLESAANGGMFAEQVDCLWKLWMMILTELGELHVVKEEGPSLEI